MGGGIIQEIQLDGGCIADIAVHLQVFVIQLICIGQVNVIHPNRQFACGSTAQSNRLFIGDPPSPVGLSVIKAVFCRFECGRIPIGQQENLRLGIRLHIQDVRCKAAGYVTAEQGILWGFLCDHSHSIAIRRHIGSLVNVGDPLDIIGEDVPRLNGPRIVCEGHHTSSVVSEFHRLRDHDYIIGQCVI